MLVEPGVQGDGPGAEEHAEDLLPDAAGQVRDGVGEGVARLPLAPAQQELEADEEEEEGH